VTNWTFQKLRDICPKTGQREAASKELNVPQSALGRVLKNEEGIEREALQNRKRKRRRGKDECALKERFVKVRNKDVRVSGPLLRQKAGESAGKKRGRFTSRRQKGGGSTGGKKMYEMKNAKR